MQSKPSAAKKKEPTGVESVTQFLTEIYRLAPSAGVRCFRGEADARWRLMPSVMRNLRVDAENNIFSELMAEAPNEFADDRSMFGRLVRAQHYGLPTRLLDVSLNPLVALYFACSDEPQMEHDGKVLILDFRKTNVRYPDSDTVSLICNLCRLTDEERQELKTAGLNRKLPDEEFQKLPSAERLAHFVRMEKPYFLNKMRSADFRKYFFVYPSKANKRVTAQSGAFVAAGLLSYKSTENIVSFQQSVINVPAPAKPDILKELDILNINSRSMFPEIEYTSRYIKRKWENERSSNIEDLFGGIFANFFEKTN
ncbi:FRG domain-containing protein [Ensifer sp. 4252]|uniref:FRG domain-containing protein n=1 Tax=Ensifer sp. 4252 TaxID=3373915 RepID=UPI003D1AB505